MDWRHELNQFKTGFMEAMPNWNARIFGFTLGAFLVVGGAAVVLMGTAFGLVWWCVK